MSLVPEATSNFVITYLAQRPTFSNRCPITFGNVAPAVLIVGSESPPFRDLTDREREEQIQRLTKSRAQIVWVGLGTPKQDFEAIRLARRIP